jgi:zinc transport system substrate-binding protein
MIRTGLLVATLALTTATSCGKKAGSGSGKPRIAVSIFPIYDLTRRIAGDRFEVLLVLPPGKSEHGYDPTPKEIARLEGSKLGIAVGHDMDGWVEKFMGDTKVFRLAEKLPTIPIDLEPIGEDEAHGHEGHEGHDDHDHDKAPRPAGGSGEPAKPAGDDHDDHDHDDHDDHGHGKAAPDKAAKPAPDKAAKPAPAEPAPAPAPAPKEDKHEHEHKVGAPDPHVWLDPDRMVGAVDEIAAQLTAIDPAGKDAIAKNATAVKDALRKLDAAIAARAKAWSKRTIVTFHGSMAYYAKRYNLRIAAVVEPRAGKEPTPSYVRDVLTAIQRGKAAALFTEPQLARGPGEMIAKEAGIPLGELDPVGGVAGRDTYEALLLWNTDQLEKVLR